MSDKANIGRILLIATSPDRNVRLTQDEGATLAHEVLRLHEKLQQVHEVADMQWSDATVWDAINEIRDILAKPLT